MTFPKTLPTIHPGLPGSFPRPGPVGPPSPLKPPSSPQIPRHEKGQLNNLPGPHAVRKPNNHNDFGYPTPQATAAKAPPGSPGMPMPSTVQLSGNYQVKMLPYADIRSRKEQAANFPVGLAKTRSLAQLSKEDRKVVQDIQKQYPGLRPLVVENSLPKSPAAFSLNLGVGKPPSRKLLKQEGVENPVHIHNKQEAERLAGDFWSRGYNLNQRTEGANIISPGSSTERVKMGASTDEVLKNNLGKCSPQQIKQIRVGLDDLAAELAQANVAFPGCSVKISVDPSNPNSRPTVELENLEHMVPAGHKDFKKAKEEALKGIKALTEDIREIQEERGDHAAGATGKA